MEEDLDSLWDWGDAAASERRFLEEAGRSQGDAKLEALTQAARAQGLQRRFEEAHARLDGIEKSLGAAGDRVRVRYLLERGRVFNSSGNRERAREIFLEAQSAAKEAGEAVLEIDALHMMGIVEPVERQLDWTMQAIELARITDHPRAKRWLPSLANNAGWSLHDSGRPREALELFREALAMRQELGQERERLIAKWCVARCLRSLGNCEDALQMQRELLAEHERAGTEDGYVYEELAECLLELGRPDESRPHFRQAFKALSADTWLAENEPERLARLDRLAGEGL
jgi:tetratricopeptide (TPR) repeat protein